jgi:hypothetical protein
MDETPDPSVDPGHPAAPPAHADAAASPTPAHGHGLAYSLLAVFLVALAFGGWGLWTVVAPRPGDARAQLSAQRDRIATLEQRATTLARSDQVSREANLDLQRTLAERDEEIAGLRADVAFYERFVGSTAQRHGLAVHQLHMTAQPGGAWHFVATLTQNLNRGAVNDGKLTVSLEGSRGGRMEKLDWEVLRQQADAPGIDFSFKYFQQVQGDVIVPAGLQPVRVVVRLEPARGEAVEQSFTWAEATAGPAP